ncbi:hypothetical protein KVR01_008198 [Diaporthe batatas]|uniref:uncharacterized protein n=1 Tax=Diaporthe batatas TaxID=748121 RepID=UPI001D04B26A|nr:uncharacterized protein KVR01_008198 [Diaporthe batatas]KAG8162433.1 hypothetical protein KVR01_008198 [Diaporthe batatas]
MTSWHDRDCRRPDVLLMDNVPTCLSCGALFLQTDETQGELSKQTVVAGKGSRRLNLDWPSSITFYHPDDIADPDLRATLLALNRHVETDDTDTALTSTEEHARVATPMVHSAKLGDSQGIKEFPAEILATEDNDFQPSATSKNSKRGQNFENGELCNASRNAVYQALMGSDEIRLLHLDPQENASEPLHGHLRPARLSIRPDYIALSYTWADTKGDRTLRDRIFLGNAWTPFAITRNCAAALRRLRLRGGICAVWVDAICIDQNNIGERSHQVSMMRDIYSKAESVTIFLGGGTDDGVDDTPARRLWQRLSEDRFHAGKEVTSGWGGQFDTQEIRDLFNQPYWSRIWVIQEVLLARQAELVLGHASVSLIEFVSNFLGRVSRAVEDLVPPWVHLSGASLFGDVDSFLGLLHKTSTCKASDDRDMVFALLGLVQGADLEGLVADYSKTNAEIYIGLTAYFLIRHGHVGLIEAAAFAAGRKAQNKPLENPGDSEGDGDLPSWVSFETFRCSPENWSKNAEIFRFNKVGHQSMRDWLGRLLPVHGASDWYVKTRLWPISCHSPATQLSSPTTYQVFGNHGTLLIRAFPVMHISTKASAILQGAFTFNTSKLSKLFISGLMAIGATVRWGISAYSNVPSTGNDDWIIEAPGCDTFLHLQASGKVPGTYKIASLSSVALSGFLPSPYAVMAEGMEAIEPVELTATTTAHYGPIYTIRISRSEDPAMDYRLWMPLISCGPQHLLFLSHWESNTRLDELLSPHQPGPGSSLAELSQSLEQYGRWLELNYPPSFQYIGPLHDFDSEVRTVSLYLERWDDCHLWSRIYEIVVEIPWREKLKELSDIKADAWHYLMMRAEYSTAGHEQSSPILWERRLLELFEDLTNRLPDIPLRQSEGEPSLGSFMSMDTCLSLCKSIRNVPEYWTSDEIRANETEILKDWIGVESCWVFLNRSEADCRALRAKFVQLRALKRLFRREQRDFLIC